jgi:DNA-binding NarL/FixJ family response regulator
MKVNVVLVDDHQEVRDGLRAVFSCDPEFRVAGEAGDGASAIPLCRQVQPELVLVDIGLPDTTGIDLTCEILRVCPQTRVVIFSVYDDEDTIMAAIRAGARGFILKKSAAEEVLNASRTVAAGGTYLSPRVSRQLLSSLQHSEPLSEALPDIGLLSPRELQVLRLVAGGRRTKEVAVLLNLEHNTVRSYRRSMMKKLAVTNLAGILRIAQAAGLIESPPWSPVR